MFIPTTVQEARQLGWEKFDVVLVSGDTYIDTSFSGVTVIGKVLVEAGYRVGIVAQPDISSDKDLLRLGEPELFWGVTGGSVDSMVANYTASGKKRRSDDFTPGGENNRRPDRAVIRYSNLIRQYSKEKKPIVIGGLEASLRRIAHYDFWSDTVRRPILFDSKADILAYGMGEKTIVEIAERIKAGKELSGIRGTCIISRDVPEGYLELPSFEEAKSDKKAFSEMFKSFYENCDPKNADGLYQKCLDRYLVQNPPAYYLSTGELDSVYGMEYMQDAHPFYKRQGEIRALDTIRFSITSHRGCYGECNFCAIAVHQGRRVRWRSEDSIIREAKSMVRDKRFKGHIRDVGGPTANMYGVECRKKEESGACKDKRCLFPEPCAALKIDHKRQIELLRKLRSIKGIKKIFVASGVRYDMVAADNKFGETYLEELVQHHLSGQMKIAPEHSEHNVLEAMGKPDSTSLVAFRELFYKLNRRHNLRQFLTYYIIAAHPGCTDSDMRSLKFFMERRLRAKPEQVQIFTPTPSTFSTLMYYTGIDPFSGRTIPVEKRLKMKNFQKTILTGKPPAPGKNRR